MLTGMAHYTCSHCGHITGFKPGLVAITCSNCGIIDIGTVIARDRWRAVVKKQLLEKSPFSRRAAVQSRWRMVLSVACTVGSALALWIVLHW